MMLTKKLGLETLFVCLAVVAFLIAQPESVRAAGGGPKYPKTKPAVKPSKSGSLKTHQPGSGVQKATVPRRKPTSSVRSASKKASSFGNKSSHHSKSPNKSSGANNLVALQRETAQIQAELVQAQQRLKKLIKQRARVLRQVKQEIGKDDKLVQARTQWQLAEQEARLAKERVLAQLNEDPAYQKLVAALEAEKKRLEQLKSEDADQQTIQAQLKKLNQAETEKLAFEERALRNDSEYRKARSKAQTACERVADIRKRLQEKLKNDERIKQADQAIKQVQEQITVIAQKLSEARRKLAAAELVAAQARQKALLESLRRAARSRGRRGKGKHHKKRW